nr:hypothetical protein [uncultured Flavobacterium sp.]
MSQQSLTHATSNLGIWLNLNMVLYLEDLANPKIGLNLVPNPLISTRTSGCEKTSSDLESIRRATKEKLKYEILKRLILVFSQTDVGGNTKELQSPKLPVKNFAEVIQLTNFAK